MKPQPRPEPDPTGLIRQSAHGSLRTERGREVPIKVGGHGDERTLLLVLLLEEGDSFDHSDISKLVLECATDRGVLQLVGEGDRVEHDVIKFRVLETLELVQRRSHFRVPAVRPVVVALGAESEVRTFSIDVSGGGMLIAGPDSLQINQQVEFKLVLGDDERISGTGVIVRVADGGRRAVMFQEMSDKDRERVIHFIFKSQRAARLTRDGR
jgi:hypothetical protein